MGLYFLDDFVECEFRESSYYIVETCHNIQHNIVFLYNILTVFIYLTGLICLSFPYRELICPLISLFMDITCVKSLWRLAVSDCCSLAVSFQQKL